MSDPIVVNFDSEDGVRAVEASEQALLTVAGAGTTARLTILGRITATGLYAPYDSGAADGSEIPKAVSLSEVVAAGAGNLPLGVLLKGKVREDKLIIDGSAAGVGITNAIKDQLRDYEIIVEPAVQTSGLDNQ